MEVRFVQFCISFSFIPFWVTLTLGSELNSGMMRYPYALPKCCASNSKSYQGRNSRELGNEEGTPGIDPCKEEGSEIVDLPRKFFPGMSNDLEYVEVELRNLVDGLQCKEEVEPRILIDLNNVEGDISTVKIGSTVAYKEFSFSGENFLVDRRILGPRDFCVSSSTKNMTKLDMKTCSQTTSIPEKIPIARCCGGYQSILTASPKKSSLEEESFGEYEYCSTPKMNQLIGGDLWNPGESRILMLESSTAFYETREFPPQPFCRLIYLRQSSMMDGNKTVTLLSDGKLQIKFENKTEVLEDFCIDGQFGNEGNEAIVSGDKCQVGGSGDEEVVVVCAPYESNEALREATALPTDATADDFIHLPYCSCGYFEKELTLPANLFRFYAERNTFNLSSSKEVKEVVPVRLMTPENGSEQFECSGEFREERTIEFSTEEIFVADGSLIFDKYLLDPSQFCIRSIYQNAVTVRTCIETCGDKKRPCVNRCCSGNNHINWKSLLELPTDDRFSFECEPQSSNGTIEWHHLPFFRNHGKDIHPDVRKRRPSTTHDHCALLTANKYDESSAVVAIPYKMKDGELLETVARGRWEKVDFGSYCVEPYMKPSGETGELLLSGNTDDILVWRCWSDIDQDQEKGYVGTMPELFASLYFTFSLFYLAIAGVYIMRSDKGPVFRWSIVSCSLSMMLTYIFFGYTRISFHFHVQEELKYWTTCAVIGMIANFIYLNSFSWITALCFDIWFTLTFVRPEQKSIKRFFSYLAFTLTLPATVVGTGIVLDVFYVQDAFSDVIIPAYGQKRCLFEPEDAALPYLYGPLAVLTSIDFLLFFHTVIKLWIARHTSEISKAVNDSRRTHRNTFLLYLKLFFMMGLLWVLETISWVFIPLNEPLAWWAIGMEIVTLLQPAFVFFFLAWNEDTKRHLGTKSPRAKAFIDFVDGIWRRLGCGKVDESKGEGGTSSSGTTKETPLYKSY